MRLYLNLKWKCGYSFETYSMLKHVATVLHEASC